MYQRKAINTAKYGVWLEDKYTFARNRRGGLNLIYHGYLYTAERRYNATVNWVCNKNSNTSLRCPARCVTAGQNTIKLGLIKRNRFENYTVIDNYRFVKSSKSASAFYLKCANFRKSCRARAVIRRDTLKVQLKDANHNHPRHVQAIEPNVIRCPPVT
ncbi:uncharacterized protein LOC106083495 [Stomoxys calcitrans]|uniref:uncharacterized protein LOC106083495 n=1 Tax=Stomoxys calcitrans TaxID=35570 RepID=UPI0027E2E577|nr:uncharacterized protein LOC106083495 [Stomoxys calcitrans]